jgi:undecaprenyl-diphosphatase
MVNVQALRGIDPEIARTAQALADHAILLLALGIAVVGVALAVIIAAVRLAGRYQKPLIQGWTWAFGQLRRLPVFEKVVTRARAVVPTGYVALHLVLGLIATAAVVAFVIVTEEVFAGREVAAFDVALANALQEHASPRWQQVFRTITWLGSAEVIGTASILIAAALLAGRYYVLALGWVIAQAGGAVLNVVLKSAFERTRPESPEALTLSTWSFPSGHAMGTFVFFGVGVYILLRFTRSWRTAAVVVAAAFAWCIIMGFTRLYLAVHFVSDVVAGLIAAAAWVAVCVSGIEVGLRRGAGG